MVEFTCVEDCICTNTYCIMEASKMFIKPSYNLKLLQTQMVYYILTIPMSSTGYLKYTHGNAIKNLADNPSG